MLRKESCAWIHRVTVVSTVFPGTQEFLLCENWPCTRLGSELVEDKYQMYSIVGEKQRAHSQSVQRLAEGTMGFAASPWQNTSVQKETEAALPSYSSKFAFL